MEANFSIIEQNSLGKEWLKLKKAIFLSIK